MLKVMTKLATWQKGELLVKAYSPQLPPKQKDQKDDYVLQQVRTSKERHLQDNFGFSSNNRVSDDASIIIRLSLAMEGCVEIPPCQGVKSRYQLCSSLV